MSGKITQPPAFSVENKFGVTRRSVLLMSTFVFLGYFEQELNKSKTRILNEFIASDNLCWITSGKEIENYIPSSIVQAYWNIQDKIDLKPYLSFFDQIDKLITGQGSYYLTKKPLLAEKLVSLMTLNNLKDVYDMDKCMNDICKNIRKWNGI